MNNPNNPKDRNLLKGAIRRQYSRSSRRREVIDQFIVHEFSDQNRPRVTGWVYCNSCGIIFPKYLAQVDHINPIIPLGKTLEHMTWDELINNLWADIKDQQCLCKDCHKEKTKKEQKERKFLRSIT